MRLGRVTVEIHDGYTVTRFDDGLMTTALHSEQPGQREVAESIGMTVLDMNLQHDLVHSMLANWLDLEWSPALRCAALGTDGGELVAAEETAVLAIQRYINLLADRRK